MTPRDIEKHAKHIAHARKLSEQSLDPTTKIGCVIVHITLDEVVGTGYNRFPGNVVHSKERLNDRPTKYMYTAHAETVALFDMLQRMIYTNKRPAAKPSELAIYVYGVPICTDCMKDIALAGIKTAYYYNGASDDSVRRWEFCEEAKTIALEDGIAVTCLNIAEITTLLDADVPLRQLTAS